MAGPDNPVAPARPFGWGPQEPTPPLFPPTHPPTPTSLGAGGTTPSENPRTLVSSYDSKDAAAADVASKVESAREAQANFDDYMSQQAGLGIVIDPKSNTVMRLVKTEAKDLPPQGNLSDEQYGKLLDSLGKSDSGKWEEQPDQIGQELYRKQLEAERDLKWAKEDATNFSKSGPAVQSYADTEEPKTKEVARQRDDFFARADEYQQLLGNEQSYSMNADQQNIANEKARQESGMFTLPDYGHQTMASSLSNILRPSLPSYVSPDYRLNAAVGLPGQEGFNDPSYNSYGMPNGVPAYGGGTEQSLAQYLRNTYTGVFGMLAPKRVWPWGAGQ